jgi:protein-L-isoaspartate O-methyltransferase
MQGWRVPSPKEHTKSKEKLKRHCVEIPPPLLDQFKVGGRLIAPVVERGVQYLMLHEKHEKDLTRKVLCEAFYVSLRGKYGRSGKSS